MAVLGGISRERGESESERASEQASKQPVATRVAGESARAIWQQCLLVLVES